MSALNLDEPILPQVHDSTGMFKADVSSEAWREYVCYDKDTWQACTYRIIEPVMLWIKQKVGKTGSHRVKDASGVVHYIPEDWKFLRWMPKPGQPDVEF